MVIEISKHKDYDLINRFGRIEWIEKEPDTIQDLEIKFCYPIGLFLNQAKVSRIKTETSMLNHLKKEVVPQLLVKKETEVKLGHFFFASQTSAIFTKDKSVLLKRSILSGFTNWIIIGE